MLKLFTVLTIAAVLACAAPSFAGPGEKSAKPDGKGERKERDPAKVFKKLDANSDGQLSFDEFKGQRDEEKARKVFARLDGDKDGILKPEEFKIERRGKKSK